MPLVRCYWRLVRPVTAGSRTILFAANGDVVLVRHALDGALYLPGGGRSGSEAPADTAARELNEELGVALNPLALASWATYESAWEGKRDVISVFTAQVPPEAELRPKCREITEVVLVDPSAPLPSSVSPGTARRLAEWAAGKPMPGRW